MGKSVIKTRRINKGHLANRYTLLINMTTEFGHFCIIKHFWEKCLYSSHYSSITKRYFELSISVKQV